MRYQQQPVSYLPEPPEGASIAEPARRVPVIAEVDVAVLGGGPAGICAAVAAAELGRSVLLIERHGFLGGNATAALVNHWHSLYGMDRATKVIGGLAERAIRTLQRDGFAVNTADDGETDKWVIDPPRVRLLFDDMVREAGCKLLLHSWAADAIVNDRRIEAVMLEGKSGRRAVRAGTFIDCTGDADLIRRTGHPTIHGDGDGHCQPPTLVFRVGGLPPIHERHPLHKISEDLVGRTLPNGEPYVAPIWHIAPPGLEHETLISGIRVPGTDAADTLSLTRCEVEARRQLAWLVDQLRSYPGWEDLHLTEIAAATGQRESHRAVCDHMLTRDEVLFGQTFNDPVAQGTWPVDIHSPDGVGTSLFYLDGTTLHRGADNVRRPGRWDGQPDDAPKRDTLCWQVPYRSLIARDFDNVLVAGRCLGADQPAAGAVRVMVSAMQLGHAAGAAARLAVDGLSRSVQADDLLTTLTAAGMPLRRARPQ